MHWDLHVILYLREGRYEAEAINAAVAGVGSSTFAALHSFEQMALSMAITAVEAPARLTFKPDAEDANLYRSLDEGKVSVRKMAALGIIGFGSFGLSVRKASTRKTPSTPVIESAKLELVGGPS